MKKIISFLPAISFFICCHAQNVGVGTLTPAEKLDVNGNVNLSGQLKLNGDAGVANQYLMKDGANNPVWGDLSGYKKMMVTDCGNFTPPPRCR